MPATSAADTDRTSQAAPVTTGEASDRRVVAFSRDRLTWLSYSLYGFWSFAWNFYAPIMPSLRGELKLSYSIASLHFSALALGLLISGLTGHRLIRKLTPSRAIWYGTAAIAVAITSIVAAQNAYCTIFSALIVGFAGSVAAQAIIASLSQRFHAHQPAVISELVVSNSLFGSLSPLVVAGIISVGLPWKSAVLIPALVLVLICWATRFGGGKSWQLDMGQAKDEGPLPSEYWLYFGIVFLSVSAEWAVSFWTPEYLERALHFPRPQACLGLSVFLFAMLAGRIMGSRLLSLIPMQKFLTITTIIGAVGFLLFWCGGSPIVAWTGLILFGLGQSNVYPVGLAAAIRSAGGRIAKATSTMSISTGLAILLAPLFLGLLADHTHIANAFGIVAILMIATAAAASIPLIKQQLQQSSR